MSNFDPIAAAFKEAINSLFPSRIVRQGEQNTPMPADVLACTVVPLTHIPRGLQSKRFEEDTGDDTILKEIVQQVYQTRVSVNFFRDDALGDLALFVSQLKRSAILQFFRSRGLGVGRNSDVRNITALSHLRQEPRAQVDIDIEQIITLESAVDKATGMTIKGFFESSQGATEVEINVT